MSTCLQYKNQSVLEHGIAVHEEWLKIQPYGFLIPYWDALQKDIANWDPVDIALYHIFHDCGKPYCQSEDERGKHFSDHTKKSAETWIEIGGSEVIASWMLHDMDIHLIKADEIDAFMEIPGSEILLLTGLAAIRANAEMFGGTDSTSFKIKMKHWERRAKAYLRRRYNG